MQEYTDGLVKRVVELQREFDLQEKIDKAAESASRAFASVRKAAVEDEVSEHGRASWWDRRSEDVLMSSDSGLSETESEKSVMEDSNEANAPESPGGPLASILESWVPQVDVGERAETQSPARTQSVTTTDSDEEEKLPGVADDSDNDSDDDEQKTLEELSMPKFAKPKEDLEDMPGLAKQQRVAASRATSKIKAPTGGTADMVETSDDASDYEPTRADEKAEEEDNEDEDDDDDYESDEDQTKTKKGCFSRPSGARPLHTPKMPNGDPITAENVGLLKGLHIKTMQSGSTKMKHGTIIEGFVSRDDVGSSLSRSGGPRIQADVQWDDGSREVLAIAGPGQLARYTLPEEQESIIPFRSYPHGTNYFFDLEGSKPPPLKKLDLDNMTPLLILPRADVSKVAEPALQKMMAVSSYAYFPFASVESCGTPFFKLGDLHSYTSTISSNGPRFDFLWVTVGLLVPIITHGIKGYSKVPVGKSLLVKEGIIILGYRAKA